MQTVNYQIKHLSLLITFHSFLYGPQTQVRKIKVRILPTGRYLRSATFGPPFTHPPVRRSAFYPCPCKPFIRSFKSNDRRYLQFPIIHDDIVFSKQQTMSKYSYKLQSIIYFGAISGKLGKIRPFINRKSGIKTNKRIIS